MKKYSSLLSFNVMLLTIWFIVYVLYIGASIIIPFVVAVLLSFIIISLKWFYHWKWLHKILAYVCSLFTIFLIFYVIGQIINANIDDIIENAPEYQDKLTRIISDFASRYGIDQSIISTQIIDKINIASLVSGTASIITSIVKNAGMIFFITVFILLESAAFRTKLALITWGKNSSFFTVFEQIQEDVKSYFVIKTFISFWVWVLSLVIMMIFGIDFFLFWAFIIFLFNYIPNVGSIIAVFFPVVFSLIQFESLYLSIVFLICMILAQVFMWNFIEPKLMWTKLNLSPLVILMSLIFWGTIWGPIGMLLSVPIMVMINIVLAHIELTRPIAVLLSEKWVVKFQETPDTKLTLKKMKKLLGK